MRDLGRSRCGYKCNCCPFGTLESAVSGPQAFGQRVTGVFKTRCACHRGSQRWATPPVHAGLLALLLALRCSPPACGGFISLLTIATRRRAPCDSGVRDIAKATSKRRSGGVNARRREETLTDSMRSSRYPIGARHSQPAGGNSACNEGTAKVIEHVVLLTRDHPLLPHRDIHQSVAVP